MWTLLFLCYALMEGSLNAMQLVFEGWVGTKPAFEGGSIAYHSSPSITA